MEDIRCYQNRELSWLKFNERVLEEAEDTDNPLCERLGFLSIFQSNLDEFYMVRVGSLHDMTLLKNEVRENKTQMTAKEQINAVLDETRRLTAKKDMIYADLMDVVRREGITLVRYQELTEQEQDFLERYFTQEILPLLSTIVVGKKQPFPFLVNKGLYAIALLGTKNDKGKIGIIPCNSGVFERMIEIPSRPDSFMLTEECILHFLPKVFEKYKIQSKALIRVTRNADIDADSIYDEDLNYREHMAEVVKLRRKLCPVRLEISREMDEKCIQSVCEQLGINENQVFLYKSPLDFSFFSIIKDRLHSRPELFYPKRVPQRPQALEPGERLLDKVMNQDVLLSFPFESITPFLNMLHEAAESPDVVSIRMTLYRLAKHSKVVESLIEAAENGKQVDVLVELKARFDEENNIEWSRRLEDAGCHVIYGLDGLKVHSKLCQITRRCNGKITYITQIGTGNYNETTSRIYTDLSLVTTNEDIARDAANVFQALALGDTVDETSVLMVAPNCLQNKVIALIDRETEIAKSGRKAYIGLKLNSLTDKKIIDKLIEASQAGVTVEMVIRGICCLNAGVPGYTDNIRVISIVGRYLEHSRIYIFGEGEREQVYIASADFMTRNTVRRVEVAVPIMDDMIKLRIRELFISLLSDNVKAREQMPDGSYHHVTTGDTAYNSQEELFRMAYDNANHRELNENINISNN